MKININKICFGCGKIIKKGQPRKTIWKSLDDDEYYFHLKCYGKSNTRRKS